MASNNRNTLNDIIQPDANVTRAQQREDLPVAPPGPEYDHVYSVFLKIMKDETAAKSFTYSLYQIAQETETYVMTLLESMDTSSVMSINTSMAYYLNALNSPSTLYGVQNPVTSKYYAGRNVLS
jgi:predicted RNA-binding protein Jag